MFNNVFQTSPESYGAFCNWKVILHCDKSRESSYSRLLAAGGATVLNIKYDWSQKSASFLFSLFVIRRKKSMYDDNCCLLVMVCLVIIWVVYI